MKFETLLFEKEDGVVSITLNRPTDANAVNLQMAKDLFEASILCSTDKSVRAVVLTGAGKLFSGGGDLASFSSDSNLKASLLVMTTHLHGAISRFVRMQAPLICAVNGPAGGAGFSLVLSCNFVIASDKAKFTLAYTGAGLSPDGSSTYFLPRIVGLRRAQEMALTNRLLTASEALDWGIANQVVTPDELMQTAQALAKKVAQGSTEAYGKAMHLMRVSFDNSLETQMELESQTIANISITPNAQEGINAFLEKRKPIFNQ